MRIGILGGSFDPVHYGHLLLAEQCREQAQLDQVWLMPAATPPHKQEQVRADPRQRVQMLELATADHPALVVCTLELDRGGLSYTVGTLRHLSQDYPQHRWYLVLGGDSLHDFSNWREPEEICRRASLLIASRPGAEVTDCRVLSEVASPEQIAEYERQIVSMPQIELSSTHIRNCVAHGRSIRYQTPPPVVEYIAAQRLYR